MPSEEPRNPMPPLKEARSNFPWSFPSLNSSNGSWADPKCNPFLLFGSPPLYTLSRVPSVSLTISTLFVKVVLLPFLCLLTYYLSTFHKHFVSPLFRPFVYLLFPLPFNIFYIIAVLFSVLFSFSLMFFLWFFLFFFTVFLTLFCTLYPLVFPSPSSMVLIFLYPLFLYIKFFFVLISFCLYLYYFTLFFSLYYLSVSFLLFISSSPFTPLSSI